MHGLTFLLASVGDREEHWWFVFPFLWLLWLGVIATILFFVFRRRSGRCTGGTDRARSILAERFARGEISGEELRERLAQLP
jgi:putative membrane protein